MTKTNYRGFEITLTSADAWSAEITNPSTGKTWSRTLTGPLEEGSEACLKRAQNMVDAFIALHGAIAA
jgi:hypothetical protein